MTVEVPSGQDVALDGSGVGVTCEDLGNPERNPRI
jgi:hypothetical protein